MKFTDLFTFEKLVTPTVIKIVYWLGLLVIVIGGLYSFFTAISVDGLYALLILVGALITLLIWRVMCELYIVVFGMFERLGHIRDALTGRVTPTQAPRSGNPY